MTTVKLKKADKFLKENRVFLSGKSKDFEYWVVVSELRYYTVIFDLKKQTYNCDCKNMRQIDCSHIVAIQKYKDILERI